jgi:hypothetical protein
MLVQNKRPLLTKGMAVAAAFLTISAFASVANAGVARQLPLAEGVADCTGGRTSFDILMPDGRTVTNPCPDVAFEQTSQPAGDPYYPDPQPGSVAPPPPRVNVQ